IESVRKADVRWREDGPDRSRIHPAIAMSADGLINRTVVHARAAADALQRFSHFAAEDARAPGVDENEVHVLGAMELALALDPGQDVDVVGNRLTRRGTRQQAQQR